MRNETNTSYTNAQLQCETYTRTKGEIAQHVETLTTDASDKPVRDKTRLGREDTGARCQATQRYIIWLEYRS